MVSVVLNDCSKEEIMNLGKELRKIRKGEDVSQEVLADRIFKDRSTVSKLESGHSIPNVQVLTEIANALGYKLSINFEKASEESSLNSESLLSGNIDIEKRKSLYMLKEYLRAYGDILETQYLEKYGYYEEDIYSAAYHKNKLNYRLSINNSNMEDVKDGIVIYVDNPNVSFLDPEAKWDRSIYMSVTTNAVHCMSITSTGTKICYNIDLVKEDFASGNKNLLFTCKVDNPMNVIISAENIKKAYIKNIDLSTIDVGNKKILKVPAEKIKTECIDRKTVYEHDIKACVDYEKVVHQLEMHNANANNEEDRIDYKLSIEECNSAGSGRCDIYYKKSKWTCLLDLAWKKNESNRYYLSMTTKSKKNRIAHQVINAEEVLETILKYS